LRSANTFYTERQFSRRALDKHVMAQSSVEKMREPGGCYSQLAVDNQAGATYVTLVERSLSIERVDIREKPVACLHPRDDGATLPLNHVLSMEPSRNLSRVRPGIPEPLACTNGGVPQFVKVRSSASEFNRNAVSGLVTVVATMKGLMSIADEMDDPLESFVTCDRWPERLREKCQISLKRCHDTVPAFGQSANRTVSGFHIALGAAGNAYIVPWCCLGPIPADFVTPPSHRNQGLVPGKQSDNCRSRRGVEMSFCERGDHFVAVTVPGFRGIRDRTDGQCHAK
jgi:hypothetical protein